MHELLEIWNSGRPFENDDVRVYSLGMLLSAIKEKGMPGSIAEIGVYKGHTATVIHKLLPEKRLYLFDTFKGFSEVDVLTEKSVVGIEQESGRFSDTSVEKVKGRMGDTNNVFFCPGLFPETAKAVRDGESFCFVHFDADLYAPAKATCEYFFPRMVDQGIMIFHDYNSSFSGVRKAVDEYFADKPSFVLPLPDRFGSALVVKYPSGQFSINY